MGFLDKLKGLLGRSKHKATEVAGDVAEKAGEVAAKTGSAAAKGVEAATATSGADKVTGDKDHDKTENVSTKVESSLDKGKDDAKS